MVELPDEVKNMQVIQPEKPAAPRGTRPMGSGPRTGGSSGGYRPGGRDGGSRDGGSRDGASRGPRTGGDREGGDARRSFGRRRRKFSGGGKVCPCCVQKVQYVDYKEIDFVQRFVSNQGKILPRRLSGACARHQRMLTTAIKRARNLALLPFTA